MASREIRAPLMPNSSQDYYSTNPCYSANPVAPLVPAGDIERGNGLPQHIEHAHSKRSGNLWTTSAHIITTVIGSGVLSLAWSVAQLGWIAGPTCIIVFAFITYYTCILLADCYRSPDPVTGKRNLNYTQAVGNILGERHRVFCGIAQYMILVGTCIGYTITAATSMVAMLQFNCHHENGGKAPCNFPDSVYILIFGVTQILLSQIPNFHQLWWLSIIAAIMSFSYATIGMGFSIEKVIENGTIHGTVAGLMDVTPADKVWRVFQALGDIAFAYAFSQVFFEIQDAIKSPPAENVTMKKATSLGSLTTTFFYMLCGCAGYAAFGDNAPGNLLTGSGFTEPYWLLVAANAFIVIHLVGAYQVLCQPVFATVERWAWSSLSETEYFKKDSMVKISIAGPYTHLFRMLWRATFVIVITILSLFLPFFNDILGIVGALSFWPLGVYFPIEMYLHQFKVQKGSRTRFFLRSLSVLCLIVSFLALLGSLVGVFQQLTAGGEGA